MKRSIARTLSEEDLRTESSVDDSSLSVPMGSKRCKVEVGTADDDEYNSDDCTRTAVIRENEDNPPPEVPPLENAECDEKPYDSSGRSQSAGDSSPERICLGFNTSLESTKELKRRTKKNKGLDWKNWGKSENNTCSNSVASLVRTTEVIDENAKIIGCSERNAQLGSGDSSSSGQVGTPSTIISQSQITGAVYNERIAQYGRPPSPLYDTPPEDSLAPKFGTKSNNLSADASNRMKIDKIIDLKKLEDDTMRMMKEAGLPIAFGSAKSRGNGKDESTSNSSSPERGPLGTQTTVASMTLSTLRRKHIVPIEDKDGETSNKKDEDGGCCVDEGRVRESRWDKNRLKEVADHTEMFIDSHCHLDFIYEKNRRFRTMEALRKEFGTAFLPTFKGCIANFIKPALNYDRLDWIRTIVKDDQILGSSWGIHPHWSGSATDESLQSLKNLIMMHRDEFKIVAIGECGIDLSGKNEVPREKQVEVFKFQVDMAVEMDLPIIIHCREGTGPELDPEDEILDILKKHPNHPIHRHCFTRDVVVAKKWMNALHNCSFGFTPLVCHASWFDRLIKHIPLDKVHLETDAPYFVPQDYAVFNQLKQSLPGAAITVAIRISEITGLPLDEVIRVTRMCTNRIYRLPS